MYKRQLPGLLISKDWNVQYWNSGVEKLFGITKDEMTLLNQEGWPPNILKLLVDQRHSVWKAFHDAGDENWRRVLEANIYRFKSLNKLYRYDSSWYRSLVQQVMSLDSSGAFRECWEKIHIDRPIENQNPLYQMNVLVGEHVLTIRPLLISASNSGSLDIVAYMPVNDDDRWAFQELGLR